MQQHTATALARHGDEETAAPGSGMAVEHLADEQGLARTRQALDPVAGAAAQDCIEARHVAGHSHDLTFASDGNDLRLRHVLPGQSVRM